jgi:excisionase family DNA binding protein
MTMNQSHPAPLQYSVSEAAAYLGLHPDSVYDLVKNGLIRSRRKGPRKGRIFFYESDLSAYLDGNVTRKIRK